MEKATKPLELKIKGTEVSIPATDHYFSKDGAAVVKHAPLERLAQVHGVAIASTNVDSHLVVNRDVYAVVSAVATDADGKVYHGIGEASPKNLDTNIATNYPVSMAHRRAITMALLKGLGLDGVIYSECQIPDKTPQSNSASTASVKTEVKNAIKENPLPDVKEAKETVAVETKTENQSASATVSDDVLAQGKAFSFPTGKHRGKTIDEIHAKDPSYLTWFCNPTKLSIPESDTARLAARSYATTLIA